jgi:hypothetical protein
MKALPGEEHLSAGSWDSSILSSWVPSLMRSQGTKDKDLGMCGVMLDGRTHARQKLGKGGEGREKVGRAVALKALW